MWLVPVRTGNIILPEIEINGKKGIWVNSLITNIQGL
jgi:C4-type Zn-finger protein